MEGKTGGSHGNTSGSGIVAWKANAPQTFYTTDGKTLVGRTDVEKNPNSPKYSHIVNTFTDTKDLKAPIKIVGTTVDGVGIAGISNGKILLSKPKPKTKEQLEADAKALEQQLKETKAAIDQQIKETKAPAAKA